MNGRTNGASLGGDHTVLVLTQPAERLPAMIGELPEDTTVVVGSQLEAFEKAAPGATVILTWLVGGKLLESLFAMAPRVRWVHSCSAGSDSALFPALRDGPVLLTNGRGVFSDALGEFVIGAVLFFAKQFRRMVRGQGAGVWDQFDTMMIAGRTMGIVGYGDIGHAAAKRAHALGMKVLSLRRRPQLSQGDALVDEVMGPDRLGELLARSDYVVVTAPLTPETRGLIGDAEFGAMKSETVIINVGRGPVIDEGALIHALQAKRIRGAALDVFHSEPLPADHPFYRLDNVLLSPHCADRTADWREQAMRLFLDNFGRFLRGELLLNLVDKRLGY